MASPRKQLQQVLISSTGTDIESKPPRDAIASRSSRELVLAFSGPIGCGIESVRERTSDVLTELGYEVHVVKVSSYIKNCLAEKIVTVDSTGGSSKDQVYIQLQEAGNKLRFHQPDILAEYAIQEIASIRAKEIPEGTEIKSELPPKRAYLIDQLKHPDEVELLRMVYGNLFFLIGVLSVSSRRKVRLKDRGVADAQLSNLIERDRRQIDGFGQQLDKTLKLADFFVRNDHANAEILTRQVRRFCNLMHGANGISPTLEEYGMYLAYAAALRSACLSRQVGASIVSSDGRILSTGRNEVPRPGGGLYGPESGDNDARCVSLEGAQCFNDAHKARLTKEIEEELRAGLHKEMERIAETLGDDAKEGFLREFKPAPLARQLANLSYKNTRLSSLIEFSRSIHAEMDAIVGLARSGSGAAQGASLFTYTFPCHNCARHIVAAGISKVYFLEPYEKSLASELHWDAIDVEPERVKESEDDAKGEVDKVQFIHFEGVAPRQYMNMFMSTVTNLDGIWREFDQAA